MVDPRELDGNPYEVAEKAAAQAAALVAAASWATEVARLMSRNAEMERQLYRGDPSDPVSWEKGGLGRRFEKVQDDLQATQKDLKLLIRAAGFDPRAPLGKA